MCTGEKTLSSVPPRNQLCRKCNCRMYPVAQPLRTEETEEGSGSFWITLCSVGYLLTKCFEFVVLVAKSVISIWHFRVK